MSDETKVEGGCEYFTSKADGEKIILRCVVFD